MMMESNIISVITQLITKAKIEHALRDDIISQDEYTQLMIYVSGDIEMIQLANVIIDDKLKEKDHPFKRIGDIL